MVTLPSFFTNTGLVSYRSQYKLSYALSTSSGCYQWMKARWYNSVCWQVSYCHLPVLAFDAGFNAIFFMREYPCLWLYRLNILLFTWFKSNLGLVNNFNIIFKNWSANFKNKHCIKIIQLTWYTSLIYINIYWSALLPKNWPKFRTVFAAWCVASRNNWHALE